MSSNDNLIVCADKNGKINDLFKVSPKNIVGDNTLPVSQQYKTFNFDKMSFMGSGEFAGIYYDDTAPNGQDKGNNLGCKGFYVHGWELVSITFTNPENGIDKTLSNTALDNYLYDKCKLYNKVDGTYLTNGNLTNLLTNSNICKITANGGFAGELTDIKQISPGIQNEGTNNEYVRYLCLGANKTSLGTLSSYPDYKSNDSTTYKYSSIKLKLHVRDEQISGFTSYLDNNNPKINCSSNYKIEITDNNTTTEYTSANAPSLLKFKIFSNDPNLPVPTDNNTLGKLRTHLQDIKNNIEYYKDYKYSYTSNSHNTDVFNLIEVDSTNCTITVESNKVLNLLAWFANDPGVLTTTETGGKIYSLRTYDTALYTYDYLDFGLCEIYPTCFAVGTNNTAAGDGAVATGMGSRAMGAFSAAFGRSSEARGYSTFAAGLRSKALIEKSVALGDSCETRGTGAFAAGYRSIANNNFSVVLGNSCETRGTGSFAAGYKSKANNNYSVALGNSCETLGINSFAAGYQSKTNKDYSVALGCQCITGDNATGAFAAGYQSITNNNYSVALGCQCITGDNAAGAFAAGYKSKANNYYSVALGNNCIAKAANSFAVGYQCITNNAYSVALGNNCITGAGSQCVVGKYNYKNNTAVFAVGGGSSEEVTVESTGKKYKKINGKNIFEVVSDGQIIVPIQGATNRFASIRVVLNKDTNNIELIYSEVDSNKNPRTGIIWLDSDGNEVADPTK